MAAFFDSIDSCFVFFVEKLVCVTLKKTLKLLVRMLKTLKVISRQQI